MPVNHCVHKAAREYNKLSLKISDTKHQITFLEDLKQLKLHPKHLYNIKFPVLFQGTSSYLDLNRPLKNIDHHISATVTKNEQRYKRKVEEFRNYCHKLEISDRYCQLRSYQNTRRTVLDNLRSNAPPSIVDRLLKISSDCIKSVTPLTKRNTTINSASSNN